MNLRKTILICVAVALIVIVLVVRFAPFGARRVQTEVTTSTSTVATPERSAEKTPTVQDVASEDDVPVAEAPVSAPPAAPAAAATEEARLAELLAHKLGLGDPFQYAHAGWESYMPAQNSQSASGVVVKGIIRLEGREPLAILHLSDSDKSFYVGKGDVIRVTQKSAGAGGMGETYLQVKDIRDHEVEIIQQERPDRVIIVR